LLSDQLRFRRIHSQLHGGLGVPLSENAPAHLVDSPEEQDGVRRCRGSKDQGTFLIIVSGPGPSGEGSYGEEKNRATCAILDAFLRGANAFLLIGIVILPGIEE